MARARVEDFQLTPGLLRELDIAEQLLHKDKEWIITHALRDFLRRKKIGAFEAEARRQSILASKADVDSVWEDSTDTEGWK